MSQNNKHNFGSNRLVVGGVYKEYDDIYGRHISTFVYTGGDPIIKYIWRYRGIETRFEWITEGKLLGWLDAGELILDKKSILKKILDATDKNR